MGGGIVLLSCLMHPNYPPVEHTEERFRSFDPRLEIHPSGCEDVEVAVITNTLNRDWGPCSDYQNAEKNRLLHIAEANRMSNFKLGFGNPEPMEAKRYSHPDVWFQPIFAENGVIRSEGTSGYQCTFCEVYAEKDGMLEHVRSNEHLQKAGTSQQGVWANSSAEPIAALSGATSDPGSSSGEPGRSWDAIKAEGLNASHEPYDPWTGAGSSTQSSSMPTRPPDTAWAPVTIESGQVQSLTNVSEGNMGLQVPGEAKDTMSLIEMALRFPDQGVVVPGSSFWISDSGLECVRTISK